MKLVEKIHNTSIYKKHPDSGIWTFLRFSGSSFVSESLDLIIFAVASAILRDTKDLKFVAIFGTVFLATLIARICSSILNYILNRNLVFNRQGGLVRSMWRYYVVAISKLVMSAAFVSLFSYIFSAGDILKTIIKIFVDGVLFIIGYFLQKIWVFRDKSEC